MVEQITSKAGSFKAFPVFLRMLLTGLTQRSSSVSVDCLAYEDLEPPSSPRQGLRGEASSFALNRRYLILTYSSEFDRVQYPLPLQYVASPDPEYLKRIIYELRSRRAPSQVERSCCCYASSCDDEHRLTGSVCSRPMGRPQSCSSCVRTSCGCSRSCRARAAWLTSWMQPSARSTQPCSKCTRQARMAQIAVAGSSSAASCDLTFWHCLQLRQERDAAREELECQRPYSRRWRQGSPFCEQVTCGCSASSLSPAPIAQLSCPAG